MSTRYVWDIFDVKSKGTGATENSTGASVESISLDTTKTYAAVGMSGYTISDEGFSPLNYSAITLSQLSSGLSAVNYPYLAIAGYNDWNVDMPTLFTKIYQANLQGDYAQRRIWYFRANAGSANAGKLIVTDSNYLSQITNSNLSSYALGTQKLTIKYTSLIYSKGDTKTGNASSSSNSAYPNDGKYGNSWYVYAGADSIDPPSVTCNTDRPERGKAVKVFVEPAQNGLGGTVSYQYQYSTNGGASWTNAGSVTTDTEKEIIVPDKAERFMARVRAQDDMGFVSADYVSGPNLAVQTVRAWVGIDGKARRIKRVWIGAGGKAKEVVNGWVGVDGKARRWF